MMIFGRVRSDDLYPGTNGSAAIRSSCIMSVITGSEYGASRDLDSICIDLHNGKIRAQPSVIRFGTFISGDSLLVLVDTFGFIMPGKEKRC